MFDEILTRPGANDAINRLINDESRKRERKQDAERDHYRAERQRAGNEAALARAALTSAVTRAREEEALAKADWQQAMRSRVRAERELNSAVARHQREAAKAEYQVAVRPIGGPLIDLRRKLERAQFQLGASPRGTCRRKSALI